MLWPWSRKIFSDHSQVLRNPTCNSLRQVLRQRMKSTQHGLISKEFMNSSYSLLSMRLSKSGLWKCTSPLNLFKNFWSFSTLKNLSRETTLRTSCINCMQSLSQEERWLESQWTSASLLWSMKTTSSTELLSYLTSLPVSSLGSPCPSEMSMLSSSITSSSHFIKCRHALSSTSSCWDAPCFSWPKTGLWLFSCLRVF